MIFKEGIVTVIRQIKLKPVFFLVILLPLLISVFLKLFFQILTNQIDTLFGMTPENLLTLILITIISSVPVIVPSSLAYLLSKDDISNESSTFKIKLVFDIAGVTAILTFLQIVLCIAITNPVPSEGWVRSGYVSLLLTLASIFIKLLISNLNLNSLKPLRIYFLCGFWLVVVPVGLLTTSPWHYIAFISPFYWINWAWVTSSRLESLISGMLIFILMAAGIVLVLKAIRRISL